MSASRAGALTSAGARVQSAFAKVTGRPIFWFAFVAVLFALPLGRSLARTLPPAPPHLGKILPFELEDQYGHRLGTEELASQTWVISFVPPDGSPAMVDEMNVLRTVVYRTRNLGSTFHMVSFASDPANDSRAARRTAVEKHCSSSRLWAFVGGTTEQIKQAYDAVLGPLRLDAPPMGQLLLVDGSGNIRGEYGTDKASIDRLMQDVGYVVNVP